MKQIGNLAVVCAMRPDILFQLHDQQAAVYVGQGPQRAVMSAPWDDDQLILKIIHELNFGTYAQKNLPGPCPDQEGHSPMISTERLFALLTLLIDDLIEEEEEPDRPVLERLAAIGFTREELLALAFPKADVDAMEFQDDPKRAKKQ